ncbi:MAG: 16S rRNA (guanine(527)-N(7))-methyltransferase RsmG [Myxococcota bacterium]
MARLAELLATWAPKMNLSGHRSAEGIVRRLVLDALALEPLLPDAERIADLGSGAGFPGLPLAILRPGARVWLVEARERRHHFQRAAVRALGLTNATPLRGRIEDLPPVHCQGVVAQALAKPRAAAELGLRWCAAGGWIAIPGHQEPPDPGSLPGIASAAVHRYAVPLGGPQRTLWLGRHGYGTPVE